VKNLPVAGDVDVPQKEEVVPREPLNAVQEDVQEH
jgi:hypothetical protein